METKQNETKQVEQKKGKPAKRKWKNPFTSNRFKRGGMSTLLSVVFIAIVVAVNVGVTVLTDRFPSLDIDMTAQGLNTLSDQAMEIAKSVDKDTTITLIGTEEGYDSNSVYSTYSSYGIESSQVSNLARRLAEANSHITVEFVDPDTNPQFISDYADDNLTTGKVLVRTEDRYRVLSISDMFSIEQDQSTYAMASYSMVDSALASALEMVNMDDVPVLAIATGHNEMLSNSNMASFVDMMESQNFQVVTFDMLTEEIPEDTQVLMIATPTTDYSAEEMDKLRTFLNDETREEPVSVMVTCYPTQGQMPNLTAFLEEWGVSPQAGLVAETDSGNMVVSDSTGVLVTPTDEILGDNSYDRLVSYYSAPLEVLFEANADISTYELWTTSDSCYVITEDTTEEEAADPETSSQVVATLSSKLVEVNDSYVSRSVMVFGSSVIFTDSFMNTTAFSDADYVRDLLLYITGTDASSVTTSTERVQTNVLDVTASRGTINILGIVFIAGIPVVILAAGLIIFLKRRHL